MKNLYPTDIDDVVYHPYDIWYFLINSFQDWHISGDCAALKATSKLRFGRLAIINVDQWNFARFFKNQVYPTLDFI